MEQTQPKKQYHVHYGPAGGRTRVDFDELWRYKDLIWLFVKRDFTVLYKQTVLGPAWILINPLLSMAMEVYEKMGTFTDYEIRNYERFQEEIPEA